MPNAADRFPAGLRKAAGAIHRNVVRSYPGFFLYNLPRALRPRNFSDHVRRKMLLDRRPYLAITADKARVRDYVRERVGEHVLKQTYAITDDPSTIDWSTLPRTYVCKATHGSGAVVVVSDDADPDARLPTGDDGCWSRFFVRPEHAPSDQVTEICRKWMRKRYGWGPGTTHEHHYRHVVPRVIVEELLRHPDGAAYEYELFVFHGRCELITVITKSMVDTRLDFFRPDWSRVQVHGKSKRADVEPTSPANLAEMVRIAETFGAETDFVRVDLYNVGDRIVFGELTHMPNAGTRSADRAFDRWLGTFWERDWKRPGAAHGQS